MGSKFVRLDNKVRVSLESHDRKDRQRNREAWIEATKDLPDDAFGESVITDWDKHGAVDKKETHIFKSTGID